MEEVAYFCNFDFEESLLKDQYLQIKHSKFNQEFEYLISWIEKKGTLYSSKKYPQEFIEYFELKTGKKFKINCNGSWIKFWVQDYQNIDFLKKYSSKLFVLNHYKRMNIISHDLSIINSIKDIKPRYLYKEAYSLSGKGIHELPKDKEKIEKLLEKVSLVKEEKLDRYLDFSTVIENNQTLGVNQNIVDSHFQYKGTIIGGEEFLTSEQKKEYLEKIEKIRIDLAGYKGVYSIDSFLYKKHNQSIVQPISEINLRKTMGYIAIKLKKLYSTKPVSKFLISRNFKNINYSEIDKKFGNNLLVLSPNNSFFHSFLISGESIKEVNEIEKKLLLTNL